MKPKPIGEFIPELEAWAQEGKLAILTGAGVSMLAPSLLPSWWELSIGAL